MEEAYSRAGLITALYVAMSISFCLPHPVAVSAFMICRGWCTCTEMLWMCVLYVSFGYKVRPRTCWCVAMDSALLFIFGSRMLVFSAGSGVNRVQVVLSGFSMRLFCFVQAKTLCSYGCMYIEIYLLSDEVHSPLNSFGYWTLNKYYYYYYYILACVCM